LVGAHQHIPRSENDAICLLLFISIATNLLLGRCAASQIASASAASFFCRFTNSLT
jgi:hypothetical protein